jgi:hypothetical protein
VGLWLEEDNALVNLLYRTQVEHARCELPARASWPGAGAEDMVHVPMSPGWLGGVDSSDTRVVGVWEVADECPEVDGWATIRSNIRHITFWERSPK